MTKPLKRFDDEINYLKESLKNFIIKNFLYLNFTQQSSNKIYFPSINIQFTSKNVSSSITISTGWWVV